MALVAGAACGPRAAEPAGGDGDAGESSPQADVGAGDNTSTSATSGATTGTSTCLPPSVVFGDRCYERIEIVGDVEAHRLIPSPRLDDYGPSFVVWKDRTEGTDSGGFFRLVHEEAPALRLEKLMGGFFHRKVDIVTANLSPTTVERRDHIITIPSSRCGNDFLLLFHRKRIALGSPILILPTLWLEECEELGFSRSLAIPTDINDEGADEFVMLSGSGDVGDVYFNDTQTENYVNTTLLRRSGGFQLPASCSENRTGRSWRPTPNSKESVLLLGTDCGSAPASLESFRPDADGELYEQRTLALNVPDAGTDPLALEAVDVDRDGADEVIIATDGLLQLLEASDSGFSSPRTLDALPMRHAPFDDDEQIIAIASGDFFGCEDAEIVVQEDGALAIASTVGEPTLRIDVAAEHFAALDINEDGSADLIASTTDGLVLWVSKG
ncbi:MAG: hypothetical protein AAGA54_36590 [Myxococcota bacterium]